MDGMNGQNGMYGSEGMYGAPYPYHPPVPDEKQVVKSARKHFSLLGGMFVVGTIVIFAVQIAVASVAGILRPEWLENGDISLLLSMLPMYLIGMPVLILLVKIVPGDKLERRHMKPGAFVVAAIMCFALVYLSNIVGNIVTAIISVLKGGNVQNTVQDITSTTSIWTIMLYMVICAPIMEEYVFRKLIVDRAARYGQGIAVLLSGLMFGLFHGNLNQFAYAFTLGVFLAFLYVKTGNLKITIALHMMINFMGGFVTSLIMEHIDLDEYLEMASDVDATAMLEYFMSHLGGWLAYLFVLLFVGGMMIAGAILFIVCLAKRKFTFDRGRIVIPKGRRFSTVMLNVGMVLYSIFWIAMIIRQLFM